MWLQHVNKELFSTVCTSAPLPKTVYVCILYFKQELNCKPWQQRIIRLAGTLRNYCIGKMQKFVSFTTTEHREIVLYLLSFDHRTLIEHHFSQYLAIVCGFAMGFADAIWNTQVHSIVKSYLSVSALITFLL